MAATPNPTYVALIQKNIQGLVSPGDARPRPQTPLTPEQQAAALRDMPFIFGKSGRPV